MLQSNLNYFGSSDMASRHIKPTNVFEKNTPLLLNDETSQFSNSITNESQASTLPFKSAVQESPALLTNFNDNSDKKRFSYPIRKLFNPKLLLADTPDTASGLLNPVNSVQKVALTAEVSSNRETSADNAGVLLGDRAVRKYEKLSANKSHMNFNSHLNTVVAELDQTINKRATGSLLNYFYLINSEWLDTNTYTRLMGNRSYFSTPYAPVKTSFPYLSDTDYDLTSSFKGSTGHEGSNITFKVKEQKADEVDLLQLPRENAPAVTASSYWDTF